MATRETRGSDTPETSAQELGPQVQTDTKIEEIERGIAEQAQARAAAEPREQIAAVEAEEATHDALEQSELARYRSQVDTDGPGLDAAGQQNEREVKMSAEWLREHRDDPDVALQELIDYAAEAGQDKVRPLLEKVAADEGQAFIVDNLHAALKKIEAGGGSDGSAGNKGATG